MKRRLLSLALALFCPILYLGGQQLPLKDFKAASDSLKSRMYRATRVKTDLKLSKVLLRKDDSLEFYFNQNLADYPWRSEHLDLCEQTLRERMPVAYRNKGIAGIYAKKEALKTLVSPPLSNNGQPNSDRFRVSDPRDNGSPLVERCGSDRYEKGLSCRYIALWQSHGRYWEESTQRWEWQRSPHFGTVEDMYTQSYVLPFLIPMLENAGAYVMTPRERDLQPLEIVVDNDAAFEGERDGRIRQKGSYRESGPWEDAGEGFADAKRQYVGLDNPFQMGSARKCRTIAADDPAESAEIVWEAEIRERGHYAVYISYTSLPNSSSCAHYRVRHLGGESDFLVNQRIGGGTWIYLGTFEFAPGAEASVRLDNRTVKGRHFQRNSYVSADAVRFGGGMGKFARGENEELSGLPAYAEGALYSLLWAGMDPEITNAHETEYTNEYASRGPWVGRMSGGSRVNPKQAGKGIPFDLSLAFHSDAGVLPQKDSIVGTLSIYTLLCDDSQYLPNGEDRASHRELADCVQSQIVSDLRRDFDRNWKRRYLWNRSYSESRTPACPAMLLEILSHQNFADMRYGLDPSFRFAVCRAVYKGMLKFLSNRYGCPYVVQPLPIHSFAAVIRGDKAELSWLSTPDPKEATARTRGYIVYTRVDDGAFDQGRKVGLIAGKRGGTSIPIEKGHIYSFKVEAYNEGGRSFPSEILSLGIPEEAKDTVLIVNNFTRISAPAWFESEAYAGFLEDLDSGVPYLEEIHHVGRQYEFRKDLPWTDDDCPGFGASYTDEACQIRPGNSFDYPFLHGKALFDQGYAFVSASEEAFSSEDFISQKLSLLDLICGKQVTTPRGSGSYPARYEVFPTRLRKRLEQFTAGGGSLLISGAHIATDVWDRIYEVESYPKEREAVQRFVCETLGYRYLTGHASHSHRLQPRSNAFLPLASPFDWGNPAIYRVETPDGIVPASDAGQSFLRYADTQISAGVAYQAADGHKCVSLGFPVEIISEEKALGSFLAQVMQYLTTKN